MTASQKFGWGLAIELVSLLTFVLGLALTSTVCGALLGIPLMLVALPCIVWGVVWCFQGRAQKAEEVIAAGVQRGIQEASAPAAPQSLPAGTGEERS